MSQRISFTIHGKVQGVFFRKFAQEKASSYNLTGYVMNTDDDKVKGEAQGSESDLKKLLSDLNVGPKAAHVVKVEKESLDPVEGEGEFETR